MKNHQTAQQKKSYPWENYIHKKWAKQSSNIQTEKTSNLYEACESNQVDIDNMNPTDTREIEVTTHARNLKELDYVILIVS